MNRLLICGDRHWSNGDFILKELTRLHQLTPIEVVIEGEAKGADTLARLAAESLQIPVLRFPARWSEYGRAAGPIRNRQMLEDGKPTCVVAFHNNLHLSRGTANMVRLAQTKRIPVIVMSE